MSFFARLPCAGKPRLCGKAVRFNLFSMSTVTEIIDAVKQLDERSKAGFLARLAEVDFEDVWDRQIAADAKAGKLDALWREAQAHPAAG